MGASLRIAFLAAMGYALLEIAFFAERNLLLPWRAEHFSLALLFFALHLAAVLVVTLPATALGAKRFPTFVPFIPVALLVAAHAVSAFRERYYALPRDLVGTLGTLGLAVAPFVVAALLARAMRGREGRSRVVATVAALAIVVWGGARVLTARPVGEAERSEARPSGDRLTARPTGQRVLVLGVDGAAWDIVDPLIAAGRMPNLAALAARGRTFDLETILPTFSPVIWTSVSTGKDRFQHGIHDVIQTRLPGGTLLHRAIVRTAFFTKTVGIPFRALDAAQRLRMSPYRSNQVRSTSVFEAASEAGLSVSQVEWYVSWPAPALGGVTISDRFHLQQPGVPAIDGLVHPDSLSRPLARHVVTAADIPLSQVLEFADTAGLDAAAQEEWARRHERFVEEMRLNMARDLSTRNVAVDLLSRDQTWDLFGVYFRAVDLSHHLTWRLRRVKGDVSSNEELRLKAAIPKYHEFIDGIVGDVLAEVPDDVAVILLSDHGYEDRFGHSRAPKGIAITAGGAFVPGSERGDVGIYDIAPTVAALLGLPVAADLVARPRTDLLEPDFVEAHPALPISTWESTDRSRTAALAGGDRELEAAEVERLRALGYLR